MHTVNPKFCCEREPHPVHVPDELALSTTCSYWSSWTLWQSVRRQFDYYRPPSAGFGLPRIGASSWRFELDFFPSRLPCRHPYRQGASSLETRTGIFSKSVTLWTPLQTSQCRIWLAKNWRRKGKDSMVTCGQPPWKTPSIDLWGSKEQRCQKVRLEVRFRDCYC